MPELLLELLSEEIPARMQARAADDLKRLVTAGLADAGLAFDDAEAFSSPRRLTLVVDGLPKQQEDVREERRGPRVGSPDKAIEGFLRSAGLASVDDCEVREVKGAEYYFAVIEKKGGETADALTGIVEEAVGSLRWPKSMRWNGTAQSWVRPMHAVLCVFDHRPVAGEIAFGGDVALPFGRSTAGHRFLAPDAFEVTDFADYRDRLRDAKVLVDPQERRDAIWREANALAESSGLSVRPDDALLDEVTGLVEWPVVLIGRIDDDFMDLPPEVLTTSMRTHQKYFALSDADGNMAPRFLVVANMETADGGAAIVAGNERVLRARLADAKFFWDQDRGQPLASRVPALSGIVFHEKLGTLGDKADRIEVLAVEIAKHVPGADKGRVRAAARLAKADLTTEMVGEFPELQGVMGRYYALEDGEPADVADAVAEHYSPLGPNDDCPTAPVSVSVALADKIDTLVGFFAIDEKPTGSKDPYALRRAALGVIRLVLENGLRVGLTGLFAAARALHASADVKSSEGTDADVLAFLGDRLKVALREKGVRHDLIDAVFSLGGEDDLVRLLARVDALDAFLKSDDGANLLTAYARAANIVRIEEKKDETTYDGPADPAKFAEEDERALSKALEVAGTAADNALAAEDFGSAMSALAGLRAPVDRFFDKVTVNVDDAAVRENRLRLLAQIQATMDRVADFSKIEA